MPRAIVEDTRQQRGKHDLKAACFEEAGRLVVRCRLDVGDYALAPRVSVDTKKDINELAGNIRADHARFRAECVRAREEGTLLVVLTENRDGVRTLADLERWRESPRDAARRRAARPYTGRSLAKACRTMRAKYGVMFDFCAPEESAARVIEILEGGEEWLKSR